MKLSDFLFASNELFFLCGENFSHRDISRIHLILSREDFWMMTTSSFLLVLQSDRLTSQDMDDLVQWAVNRSVSGIAFMGRFHPHLTALQQELLCNRGIFVLALPRGSASYHLIYQASSYALPGYDLETFSRFQDKLLQLCAAPYTVPDLVALLNRFLTHPADLVAGHDFHPLIRHSSLGIVDMPAIIAQNADLLSQTEAMHICYGRRTAAAVFPLQEVFAFLAIPLNHGSSLSDLDIAIIQEALPYLSLSLQGQQTVTLRSQEELYLSLLTGSASFSQAHWREDASALGVEAGLPRVVWLLQAGEPPEALVHYLSDRLPDSFVHTLEKRLVVVSPVTAFPNGFSHALSFFRDLLSELRRVFPMLPPVTISSSKVCPDLQHLSRAYDEAMFSMAIGPKLFPHLRIHLYQFYMLYQILCSAWDTAFLEQIQDNILTPIHTYEREKHTCLTDTLESFIQNGLNISRTAEAMGIHRNTLYKRIERIGQILHMDMYDSQNRILLYLAMKIDQIIKIFPDLELGTT